jgi:hypothetical protein
MKLIESQQHYEIFIFLNSFEDISYTQNTNGYFIDINELSEDILNSLSCKIENMIHYKNIFNTSNNELTSLKKEISNIFNTNTNNVVTKDLPLDIDKKTIEMVSDIMNKPLKTNVYMKYSVAKKKYNKQTIIEYSKKIENDNDLNELLKEEYII